MQSLNELHQLIADRYISVQKHPTVDLFIYNYAPKTQYERLWNDWTLTCRGLILDAAGQVVARPFRKFFNLEEHDPNEIPVEPFDVYEKMDGSLGILYWLNDRPYLATRGSFTSEQSQRGTKVLYDRYAHTFDRLDRSKTYLFEIIYPENRIVVDYADLDDLVLLAVIDNETGQDENLPDDLGFPVVKRYDSIADFRMLSTGDEFNREGFVVKFESGLRVKIKLAEYVRLHRIMTGVSNVAIWEYLAAGKSLDELLEAVPDEFYAWVKQTKSQLETQYVQIDNECRAAFQDLGDRKENAFYYQTQRYPSVLFKMLDNKPYDSIIWKHIRPTFQKAFKADDN
ncbi:2'-5' RNA ligase [Spirosoma sp. HMF4905]|uniref:2'-5' RNA ligase n=1 Tax=Spirosoma arboris TaxID=2682092 RepID=A0A7K1SMC5_9BACT|nr:RNA ligase [Spirosoma arboris]MVM34937.1 2'-5' RNA ligase [Spirosoma arboris]